MAGNRLTRLNPLKIASDNPEVGGGFDECLKSKDKSFKEIAPQFEDFVRNSGWSHSPLCTSPNQIAARLRGPAITIGSGAGSTN